MGLEIIVTLLTLLAFGVGIAGIVIPILPGSIIIIFAVLIWTALINEAPAWILFGVITLLTIIGAAFNYVYTGKKLKSHQVPNWVLIGAGVGAIAGMILLPGPGLLIGFFLGIVVAELIRFKNLNLALKSTLVALKALGVGILVEVSIATLSSMIFLVSAVLILLN